jgi:hypothetical protein
VSRCQWHPSEVVSCKEHAADFAGWTLDNTRGNLAAMRKVETLRPEWVNVGFSAHGFALATKDFCKHNRTKGRHSAERGV